MSKQSCVMCGKNAFVYTAHNGLGYCFVCGYLERNGASYKTTKKERSEYIDEIRRYYTQMVHYYHSNLTGDAYRYVLSRGYTDQTIQDRKIGYCPKESSILYRGSIAKLSGIVTGQETAALGNHVIFPYWMDDTTVTDIRGRNMDADAETRYQSAHGAAYTRGADYPYNYKLLSQSGAVVITEGEIKADIATQAGVPTIGLPGINAWRSAIDSYVTQVRMIVLFDSQREMMYINRAIHQLAKRIPDLYVATLPLHGRDKLDCDDYITEFGADSFKDVVSDAIPYSRWSKLIC